MSGAGDFPSFVGAGDAEAFSTSEGSSAFGFNHVDFDANAGGDAAGVMELTDETTIVLSGGSGGSRMSDPTLSFNDMKEKTLKMHEKVDNLIQRVVQSQRNCGELWYKGAALFNSSTSNTILNLTEKDIPKDMPKEVNDLPDPMEVHFARDDVDNKYESLVKDLPPRDKN